MNTSHVAEFGRFACTTLPEDLQKETTKRNETISIVARTTAFPTNQQFIEKPYFRQRGLRFYCILVPAIARSRVA